MKRGDIIVYTGKELLDSWQEFNLAVDEKRCMNIFGELDTINVVPGTYEYSTIALYSMGVDEEWKDYFALFCLEAADWKKQAMRDINAVEELITELGK